MPTRDLFSDRVEAALQKCRVKPWVDRLAPKDHSAPPRPADTAAEFGARIEAALQKLRPPVVPSSAKRDATVDRAAGGPGNSDSLAALPPAVASLVRNWASISPAARAIILRLARTELNI